MREGTQSKERSAQRKGEIVCYQAGFHLLQNCTRYVRSVPNVALWLLSFDSQDIRYRGNKKNSRPGGKTNIAFQYSLPLGECVRLPNAGDVKVLPRYGAEGGGSAGEILRHPPPHRCDVWWKKRRRIQVPLLNCRLPYVHVCQGALYRLSLTNSREPSSCLDTMIFSACCAASTSATPLISR